MKRGRKSRVNLLYMVYQYTELHLTAEQIGKLYGVTRQQISKLLRAAGVKTEQGEWVNRSCAYCGNPVKVTRARARQSMESFCNTDCYAAKRENPDYIQWRQGGRIARVIVAQYFDLQPEHVVDHRDGNNRNNNRDNLRVYASQSDHMKMHHGKSTAIPLWDGATIL